MEGPVHETVNPDARPTGTRERSAVEGSDDGGPPSPAQPTPRPAPGHGGGERRRDRCTVWSCLFVFSLLAGNYLIRPVRDEMGIAGGTANLPALFAGTFAAMLALGPLLSSRLRARTGRPSIEPILRAHQICLAGFFVAFHVVPPLGQAWAARAFFILASVANLLVVSIAWGSLVCRFSTDAAHRLFGFIAAGGTLGAIAGSARGGVLAVPAGPTPLILVAIGFLEVSLLAARRRSPARRWRTRPVRPA